jgi:hypothetical protein
MVDKRDAIVASSYWTFRHKLFTIYWLTRSSPLYMAGSKNIHWSQDSHFPSWQVGPTPYK